MIDMGVLPGVMIGFVSPVAEFTPKVVQTEELRTSLVYEIRVFVNDPGNKYCRGCIDRRFVDAVLPSINGALAGCACPLSHRCRRLCLMIASKRSPNGCKRNARSQRRSEKLRVASVHLRQRSVALPHLR